VTRAKNDEVKFTLTQKDVVLNEKWSLFDDSSSNSRLFKMNKSLRNFYES